MILGEQDTSGWLSTWTDPSTWLEFVLCGHASQGATSSHFSVKSGHEPDDLHSPTAPPCPSGAPPSLPQTLQPHRPTPVTPRPTHPAGKITLPDLKRCKLAHVFFDTFFNVDKYLDYEQREQASLLRVRALCSPCVPA